MDPPMTEDARIYLNSGPHIVNHLRGRVSSLTEALQRAHDRITELERAFGSDAELLPLQAMGLTPSQARLVHCLRSRDMVTARQLQFAMYADNPDKMGEVDSSTNVKVHLCQARKTLKRFGVSITTIGRCNGTEGYRMTGPDKSRLAKLLATKARSGVRFYGRAAE